MKRLLLVFLLGLVLSADVWAAPEPAKPDAIESAFKAGNDLMEKRDYAGALAQYRIVLEVEPDEPASLWNAGSAAFFVGEYPAAATYFERLQKQEPHSGAILAKRIQTAQESGDTKTRDALRAQIFALHQSGKDETGYAAKPSFCRDQFFVGKDLVLAFEYFELKPMRGNATQFHLGRVYEFFVVAPDDSQKLRIECGWSSLDKAGEKFVPSRQMPAFYYDAYFPAGTWERLTYGLEAPLPTYEEAKKRVVEIIEGSAKPVSGRKRETA